MRRTVSLLVTYIFSLSLPSLLSLFRSLAPIGERRGNDQDKVKRGEKDEDESREREKFVVSIDVDFLPLCECGRIYLEGAKCHQWIHTNDNDNDDNQRSNSCNCRTRL